MLFYQLYPISFFDSNGARTPMQWTKGRNRGFTKEVPHSKVLKAQNTEVNGATVTLKPQSFVILEN